MEPSQVDTKPSECADGPEAQNGADAHNVTLRTAHQDVHDVVACTRREVSIEEALAQVQK